MVIHEPGDWLAESLQGLAEQDYAGLQILLLLSGTSETPGARATLDVIESVVPAAVVRFLGSNPGYAATCNTVLNLVQGDSGFFCFLHDDVALAPDAVSRLVEELYRSNAGVVGPKLVHWDNASMIQSVGSAVDRFGVELPYADDGELDQEQHDAVQDVFVLASSCLMVRADLFRTLGGFTVGIHSSGVDLDFCWRAHATGARVVIVPSAVARHREAMGERSESDDNDTVDFDSESTRVRTVAALSSRGQLLPVVVQMVLFTVARAVLLVVTGRARRAGAELRAVATLPLAVGQVNDRRERVSETRTVDGDEIRALQILGSAHTSAYFRRRARRTGLAQALAKDDVREPTPRGAYVMWCALAALMVVGSRSLLLNGSVSVGQFVPFPGSVRETFQSYASGWWGAGFGQVSALPTGTALVGAAITAMFGQSGLAHTLTIVGLPVVGWLGAWRFASVVGTRGGRIAAATAYAAVPLPYASIASGRWGALLLYALMPWIVHLMRMLVGHADVRSSMTNEAMVVVAPATWRRWFAGLSLLVAICFAFEPAVVLMVPMVGAVIAVTSLAQGLAFRWSARWIGVSAASAAAAVMLNLPWSATYVRSGWWEALTAAPVDGGRNLGLWGLVRFSVGGFFGSTLSVGLFAAVVGAVLLVRGARASWSLRGASLVAVGLLVSILDDSALLPAHLAEPAVMLVPVAFGLSVCASTLGSALALDLGRGKFSWRQPLGALVGVVFAVGLVPSALNAVDGSWNQPSLALPQLLEQLPSEGDVGNYRTLFIGDPRVLPGAPLNFGWGVGYSVVNGPSATLGEMWEVPPTRARDNAVAALYGIVRGQTARAGRLLAPLSVRYIVVPIVDGGQSTRDEPIALPDGVIEALSRQLDLKRRFASPDLVVFENTAWIPVRATLSAAGATSSASAGAESMIATDISGGTAFPGVTSSDDTSVVAVEPGTVHLAVPFTSKWNLEVNGASVPVRPAFGLTNAYDVARPGSARLTYSTSILHRVLVVVQAVAWAALLFVATSRRRALRRRRRAAEQGVLPSDPAVVMGEAAGS